VDPVRQFDTFGHVSCGDVFVARHMSDPQAEREAMVHGVGLVDRATEGWARVCAPQAPVPLSEMTTIDLASIAPGRGARSEVTAGGAQPPIAAWAFADGQGGWVSSPRVDMAALVRGMQRALADVGGRIDDHTDRVDRVALVGPDAMKLFTALAFEAAAKLDVGDHAVMDVIGDPVRVARTDFVGRPAYELIIDAQTFNAVLAVLCSWAVALELNLLPVGVDAVAALSGDAA
jgi:glycine cleavage system aminomethyltransferase T